MAGATYKYNAFISYSHAADNRLAPALQSALQRFAKPLLQARSIRVFRDETGLGLTPTLWPAIEQALGESEYFILLASPQAAASEWVRQEINWWLQHRDVDHLLLACTDGDLPWDGHGNSPVAEGRCALPEELAKALDSEPKYCNLRFARTSLDLSLRNPHFLFAVSQLSAVLRGRPLDELVDKEVRQNRRVHFLVRSTVAVLAGLVVLALVAARVALYQRGIANRQRTVAEEQREISRKRLVEVMVSNGTRHWREGTYAESLLWFVEALKLEPQNSPSAQAQRMRIASTIRQQPALRHVWFEKELPADENIRVPVNFSEDGRFILFRNSEGFRVWDAQAGTLAFEWIAREDSRLADFLFTANAQQIVTVSGTKAQIRRVPAGTELRSFEHPDPVVDATITADGSRIATVSEDSKIRVWDALSGQEIFALDAAEAPAGISFSMNGKRLAYLHGEHGITIWDLETRQGVLIKNENGVQPILSPDGEWLLTIAVVDRMATLWDTKTGERLSGLGDWEWVDFACFSPDGKTVFQASRNNWIELRGIDEDCDPPMIRTSGAVTHAVFSMDGKRFATGDTENSARVWDEKRRVPVGSPLMHENTVSYVDLDPTGTRLVTRTANYVLRVWELTNRSPVLRVQHQGVVESAVFNRDQSLLLTSNSSGARLTDLKTQQSVNLEIKSQLYSAEFNEDGTLVVTGTRNAVSIWDAKNGKLQKQFPEERRVQSVRFLPGGKRLVAASRDQLRVLDVDTGKVIHAFEYVAPISQVRLSRDGTLAAGASFLGITRVWDLVAGKELEELRRSDTRLVNLSADGTKVAFASENDFTIQVIDVRTAKTISRTARVGRVYSLCFSPDATRLAAASDGASTSARIWDVATGAALTPPLPHSNRVQHVEFSPDGRAIATASSDRTARLWDAFTGIPLTPPFQHNETVADVEFSADGLRLATASHDDTAVVWDISPADGPVSQLERAAQLLAAQRLDPTGSFVTLPSAEFLQLWTNQTNTPAAGSARTPAP